VGFFDEKFTSQATDQLLTDWLDQTSLQSVGNVGFFDEKIISQATDQLMTDWLDFWHFMK